MDLGPHPITGVKYHRCDNCGKEDQWGPDWLWYGSIIESENTPHVIPEYCCSACKKQGGTHRRNRTAYDVIEQQKQWREKILSEHQEPEEPEEPEEKRSLGGLRLV